MSLTLGKEDRSAGFPFQVKEMSTPVRKYHQKPRAYRLVVPSAINVTHAVI